MLKKLRRALLTIVLFIPILVPANSASAGPPAQINVLVTFNHPPGPAENQLIDDYGGMVKKVYTLVPTILAEIYEDDIPYLSREPGVKSVVADSTISIPPYNAPSAPSGMMSPLSGGSQVLPWGIDRIDAELVHSSNNGTGVKVAILDTGIDLDHPDLNVAGGVTLTAGPPDGDDDNGHGTAIAGIIAALDNDIGVVGVAPEAEIYSVKVLGSNGGGWVSEIINGIEWAVNNNMQMIVMNFSGGGVGAPGGFNPFTEALQNAHNAGILLVCGAGNNGNPAGTGNTIPIPANEAPVMAVGGTDNTDARYASSGTGYKLEVAAPAVNIYSTTMGGGYGYTTGTSFATPHTAGIAALLIKSGITNELEIRRRIRDAAQDLGTAGWDIQFGKGIVNAYAALNFSQPPDKSAPVTTISINGTLGTHGDWYRSDMQITVNATDYGGSGVAFSKYSLDGGQTWNNYTGPFMVTTENWNTVIARSWDNAGNDEGPCVFTAFCIDKTPPAVTISVSPTQIVRGTRSSTYTINFTGTWDETLSGFGSGTVNCTDEYGVYTTDFSGTLIGQYTVQKWCRNNDSNGRTYTFRITVIDWAGNVGWAEAISRVTKN